MNREVVYTPNAPIPNGPYVQAIKAKGLVFATAQVARDPVTGEFVDGTLEEQFRLSMKNLEAILVAGGSSMAHLVNIKVFYLQLEDLPTINAVLDEFLTDPPSRSSMAAAFLWKKCRVTVEATGAVI